MNQKAELLKIEERLGGIENTIAAGKEMTEIGLKDIEKCFEEEHYYNREKFMDILENMNMMSKKKKDEVEEERGRTEESEEEEEELLPGAKGHDMN
eukprot:15965133-Heterocapsa_arctica.AAC.1